ncbi:Hypothetical predicted protein [Octopus vulgaris]|uniref:Uncharacterized protein n=1 Tax=Octopus vulgaris TaxID=6645 RepID=A0AA36AQ79_OCTVU|nr:Hypothetical predicted protein [Octopus vulgaris]
MLSRGGNVSTSDINLSFVGCEKAVADVMLVLDDSGSVGSKNFAKFIHVTQNHARMVECAGDVAKHTNAHVDVDLSVDNVQLTSDINLSFVGCEKAVADVMLVLDDSGSVGSKNFAKVKTFAQNIVKSFNIGRNKIRVGAITFSDRVKLQFRLNRYYNKKNVLKAINRIKYKHGSTNTHKALDYLRRLSFRRRAGDRILVPNIAIVLTDGKSNNLSKTKSAALKLRKTGAIVFAIGVGKGIKRSELNVIGSSPRRNHVFSVKGFNVLNSIVKRLTKRTCNGCEKAVADVMLVLDDSGSVGSKNFAKVKTFAQNIVKSFNIGRNKIRVGAITFSDRVKLQFRLNRYYNKKNVLKAINRIKYKHGSTNTHKALDYLRRLSFRRRAGDRILVPNIAIVLTDGKSNNLSKTKSAALKLRKTGAIVFAIGVGKGIKRSELNVIGSSPRRNHVFSVKGFNVLNSIVKRLTKRTCNGCEKAVADVMLVLDDSGSVGSKNFAKVKTFAQNIVKSFNIGRNKIRVGAITFSNKVKLQFRLNRYYNKKNVLKAINRIKYKHGSTNTHKALDYLRRLSFRRRAGDRKLVPNIAIVLTDGKSNNLSKTKSAALKLRKTGAIVFAIGVGKGIKRSELNVIGSSPRRNHVFSVKGFNVLNSIVKRLTKRTCNGCEKAVADVMLVLDDSGSVGSKNFAKVKTFAQNIVKSFNIGRNKIRVGAITFSDKVKLQFRLNRYYNKKNVLKAINRIKYKHGSTNTHKALDYLRRLSFRRRAGDRKLVPNIAIVLTDGKSNNLSKTKSAALKLRKTGAIVFAIGVGKRIKRSELNVIGSSPRRNHVFSVKGFNVLNSIVKRLTKRTCNGCEKAVADVMLVLDDSGSVGSKNFAKVKTFAQNIVKSFNIGRNKIRVGAITFSDRVKLQFRLNRFYNKKNVLKAINRIKYKHGSTNTHKALDYLRRLSFRRRAGDRILVPNIAIVLTDGKSNNLRKTKSAALKLRKTGAIVFAIGVGKGIKRSELNVIGSSPRRNHVFSVKGFNVLNSIVKRLTKRTCNGCEKAVADVMLVLDDSGSVGSKNFAKVKTFAQNIVKSFNIGRYKIRVGAITFSDRVKLQFRLNRYYNKKNVLKAINRIKYKHGSTNTHKALDYLRRLSFRRRAGDRKLVPNIAIVLTDGKSNNLSKTKSAALKLRKTGAIVFAIGVGKGIKRSELNVIGSSPRRNHVFSVKGFNVLNSIVKRLTKRTCNVPLPPAPITSLCQCRAVGDPHYRTFDGQMIHFMGSCKYTLASTINGTRLSNFNVEVKNEHRGYKRVSYTRLVDIKINGVTLRLYPKHRIAVNNELLEMPLIKYMGFTVVNTGGWVIATTTFGLLVKFDGNHRVIVQVPSYYKGQLTGICGDCNGRKDDWRTKTGVDVTRKRNKYSLIGKSYAVIDDSDKPSKKCEVTDPSTTCSKSVTKVCDYMKNFNGVFKRCIIKLGIKVVQQYIQSCKIDACAYKTVSKTLKEVTCRAYEGLVRQCEDAGVLVNWRGVLGCRLDCSRGKNMMYKVKIAANQPTCFNRNPPAISYYILHRFFRVTVAYIVGKPLEESTEKHVEQCAHKCLKNKKCKSFNFDELEKKCQLYDISAATVTLKPSECPYKEYFQLIESRNVLIKGATIVTCVHLDEFSKINSEEKCKAKCSEKKCKAMEYSRFFKQCGVTHKGLTTYGLVGNMFWKFSDLEYTSHNKMESEPHRYAFSFLFSPPPPLLPEYH